MNHFNFYTVTVTADLEELLPRVLKEIDDEEFLLQFMATICSYEKENSRFSCSNISCIVLITREKIVTKSSS